MRVLLVHNAYQQSGGEDAVVAADHDVLLKMGFNVQCYSRQNDEINGFSLDEKLRFPLHSIRSPATMCGLAEKVAAFRPDVAYLHNLYPLISPAAYDVLHEAGVPVVQMVHNFRPFCVNGLFLRNGRPCEDCLTNGYWNAIRHRCFRGSLTLSTVYALSTAAARKRLPTVKLLFCPSEFVREKFIEAGVPEERIRLRPNSVDTHAVRPAWLKGEYALYLGRLSEEKGVRTLLQGFRQAPDVPLVIAGSGPLEAELREFVSANSMRNVHFAGFVSGTEKWDLFDHAAFVVLPSECYESCPVLIPESFAKGKPILASRIGSLPGLVEDWETGLLFDAGSPHDMAAKANALFNDVTLCTRLGASARQAALSRFDSTVCSETLLDALEFASGRQVKAAVC